MKAEDLFIEICLKLRLRGRGQIVANFNIEHIYLQK